MDPRNSTNTTAGAPGLDGTANARFDPLRDNNTRIIDVLYYDENDGTGSYPHHATIYYKAVDIGDGTTTPDFSLTANAPTSATVTAGSSASYVLTLTALNGFSSGVSLACSSLPSGANCSFSPANPVTPTSPGSSEIVTISTATTTTAGTYTVTVTGDVGIADPTNDHAYTDGSGKSDTQFQYWRIANQFFAQPGHLCRLYHFGNTAERLQ